MNRMTNYDRSIKQLASRTSAVTKTNVEHLTHTVGSTFTTRRRRGLFAQINAYTDCTILFPLMLNMISTVHGFNMANDTRTLTVGW